MCGGGFCLRPCINRSECRAENTYICGGVWKWKTLLKRWIACVAPRWQGVKWKFIPFQWGFLSFLRAVWILPLRVMLFFSWVKHEASPVRTGKSNRAWHSSNLLGRSVFFLLRVIMGRREEDQMCRRCGKKRPLGNTWWRVGKKMNELSVLSAGGGRQRKLRPFTRCSTVDFHYRTLWRKAAMTDSVSDGTQKRGGAPAACGVSRNTSSSLARVFTLILDVPCLEWTPAKCAYITHSASSTKWHHWKKLIRIHPAIYMYSCAPQDLLT